MIKELSFERKMQALVSRLQDFYLLSFKGVTGAVRRPFYYREIIEQMESMGADSLPIVSILSLFVGMALSLQVGAEFAILGFQMYTGRVVGISIISEIGPVMIAVVFAGRSGSGIASELGSLVLKNQVDVIRVFGVDPIKKLVTPRIISALIMLPLLTIIGDAVSLMGGAYIEGVVSNQSLVVYWNNIRLIMQQRYILPGLLKPFIFGYIIASVSCFTGLATKGGALGLRSSTTQAFVISTILIIIADFFVTKIILYVLGIV